MKDELRWMAFHLYSMLILCAAGAILVTVGVLLAKYVKWLWSVL